jgi:uncharacterized small protein (TIGR04563 family)
MTETTQRSQKKSDKRKQSLYFPEEMLQQIRDEANRQDRSLSYIVQRAIKHAMEELRKLPSAHPDELPQRTEPVIPPVPEPAAPEPVVDGNTTRPEIPSAITKPRRRSRRR